MRFVHGHVPSSDLDRHPSDGDVTWRAEASHTGRREREADSLGQVSALVVRLVPGRGRPRRVAPGSPGASLDRHDAHVSLCCRFEQRLEVVAILDVGEQRRVDRHHDGVEVIAPERLELGSRRRHVVPGDPDEPAQPLVTRLEEHLDSVTTAIELLEIGHGMELVEVELVDPKLGQGLVELGSYAVRMMSQRLARNEQRRPVRLDGRTEEHLRSAVLGGNVDVVDPGRHRVGDQR